MEQVKLMGQNYMKWGTVSIKLSFEKDLQCYFKGNTTKPVLVNRNFQLEVEK